MNEISFISYSSCLNPDFRNILNSFSLKRDHRKMVENYPCLTQLRPGFFLTFWDGGEDATEPSLYETLKLLKSYGYQIYTG